MTPSRFGAPEGRTGILMPPTSHCARAGPGVPHTGHPRFAPPRFHLRATDQPAVAREAHGAAAERFAIDRWGGVEAPGEELSLQRWRGGPPDPAQASSSLQEPVADGSSPMSRHRPTVPSGPSRAEGGSSTCRTKVRSPQFVSAQANASRTSTTSLSRHVTSEPVVPEVDSVVGRVRENGRISGIGLDGLHVDSSLVDDRS